MRRLFPALSMLLAWLPAHALAAAFGWADVSAIAQREAAAPYVEPAQTVPAELAGLGYDALRDIRYRPDHAIWRREGLPFELQLFHLGGGNRVPVRISEVVDGTPRALGYEPAAWDLGRNRLSQQGWGDLGHAGFRVHFALNNPAYKDELVVFLGASYFRALGRGQQYGLSARALAIDTIGGAQGEEFPRFKAFWIERPAPGASTLTIHALLESRRATAAWRIVLRPGEETTMDVQQRVYLRTAQDPVAGPIRTLGIAPLTSMFLHGDNQPARQPGGDFRPEVHDSDGLLLAADGQWLWRPLFNPATPMLSSLGVQRLQGFGLMQRDRRFDAYEDAEAHYERRPSAWVEALGDWGAGRVELLQLHTPDETHDNVVAYWVPAQLPPVGQPLELAYRLHWQGAQQQLPPNGWAVQARRGRGWLAAADNAGARDELQFFIDFDGPALRALPPGASVEAAASVGPGARIAEARAWPHPQGGWRMQLRVQRTTASAVATAASAPATSATNATNATNATSATNTTGALTTAATAAATGAPITTPLQPLELRAHLQIQTSSGPQALTETWAALVPPEPTP